MSDQGLDDIAAYMEWRQVTPSSYELDVWRAALKWEREQLIEIIHREAMNDITVSHIEIALRERFKGLM